MILSLLRNPMAELSPAFIFATVYIFQSYITWLVSNHDRQIMSENPGVYMAMKSAVSVHPLIEKQSLKMTKILGFLWNHDSQASK